jgi:hypothetical protein
MAYLVFALIAGAVTATMQGFGVRLLKRLVSRTALSHWMLVGSLTVLALTVARAQCAMCSEM